MSDIAIRAGGSSEHKQEALRAAWVFLGFALLYLVFIWRTVFTDHGHQVGTLFDDALVSMRFAQNLAAGHGLVWNPGEIPRVEGYTNLLWTLIMSVPVMLLSVTVAPIAVSVLGAAILLACGVASRKVLRLVGAGPARQLAGAILVMAYFPLVFWTIRGMEVGLLTLLLLCAISVSIDPTGAQEDDAHSRRRLLVLSSLSGIAFLTRNDSIVLFSVVVGFTAWQRRVRHLLLFATAPLAVCVVAQIAFRYKFYGELFPNTYILKMTGVPLAVRTLSGLRTFAKISVPLVCFVSIASADGFSAKTHSSIRTLSLMALALVAFQASYLIWVGGDAWLFDFSNRFIATAIPVLLLATVANIPSYVSGFGRSAVSAALTTANILLGSVFLLTGTLDLGPRSNRILLAGWVLMLVLPVLARLGKELVDTRVARLSEAAVVAACLFTSSGHAWVRWAVLNGPAVRDDIAFAKQGLMLRGVLPADATIAASWLGAPSYFTGLHSIDLLGKTDKHVARLPGNLPFHPGHNKMDLDYSIGELRPDVVLFDAPVIAGYGYMRLPNQIWIERQSFEKFQNTASLAASWCESPAESTYCPGQSTVDHAKVAAYPGNSDLAAKKPSQSLIAPVLTSR